MTKLDTKSLQAVSGGTIGIGVAIGFGGGCKPSHCGNSSGKKKC